MDFSIWEICSKLAVIKDYVEKTNSLKRALTLANSVRQIKQVFIVRCMLQLSVVCC